jgi:hypothetical protein
MYDFVLFIFLARGQLIDIVFGGHMSPRFENNKHNHANAHGIQDQADDKFKFGFRLWIHFAPLSHCCHRSIICLPFFPFHARAK